MKGSGGFHSELSVVFVKTCFLVSFSDLRNLDIETWCVPNVVYGEAQLHLIVLEHKYDCLKLTQSK